MKTTAKRSTLILECFLRQRINQTKVVRPKSFPKTWSTIIFDLYKLDIQAIMVLCIELNSLNFEKVIIGGF